MKFYLKAFFSLLISTAQILAGYQITYSQNSAAQTTQKNIHLHGLIIDLTLKQHLAYVSIGIPNTSAGTISDSSGHFDLTIKNEYLNDTLQVSLVGYKTVMLPVKQLSTAKDGLIIKLTKTIILLKEVTVSNKFQQTEIVGRQSSGKLIQASIIPKGENAPAIGAESGLKIQVKHYPALLSNFNFYLSANNFKHIKFRLNIYSLKNNLPDTILFNKEIFVDINNFKTGWTTVDLSGYEIVVNADFAMTMQWVDYDRAMVNQPEVLIPGAVSFSHTSYFRTASQDKWNSIKMNFSFFATLQY